MSVCVQCGLDTFWKFSESPRQTLPGIGSAVVATAWLSTARTASVSSVRALCVSNQIESCVNPRKCFFAHTRPTGKNPIYPGSLWSGSRPGAATCAPPSMTSTYTGVLVSVRPQHAQCSILPFVYLSDHFIGIIAAVVIVLHLAELSSRSHLAFLCGYSIDVCSLCP